MTLPLRLGNIWYFSIRLLISNRLRKKCTVPNKNYTNNVLCVTATDTSAQITVTQQRSQCRNNSSCILNIDDVKCLVRSVREWLEKYHEDVPWDLINDFWEYSFYYCKFLKLECKYLELGNSVLHKHSNFWFHYFRTNFLEQHEI